MNKKNILGVGITDATKEEVLEYLVKNLENFQKKLFIVTPNPEFLVLANENPTFKEVLNKADLALADGIGVVASGQVLGKPLKERFAGVELLEKLCMIVAEKPITVGFLGGRGGVAEKTAERLRKKYPGLKVGFVGEEWSSGDLLGETRSLKASSKPSGNTSLAYEGKSNSPAVEHSQKSSKNFVKKSFREEFRPVDILFVAFGAPKQEFWINDNLEMLPVKVAVGVGGAFDYIGGKVPRAPLFVQKLGMEWLFRLIVQPWRIKRQLSLLKFVWLVVKEKFSKN